MAREDILEINAHKKTEALVRRRAIRKVLASEHHSTIPSVRDRLADLGFDHSEITVRLDLQEVGAVRIQRLDKPGEYQWIIPAYNPALEQLRKQLDPEQIEYEVQLKMAAHSVDVHVAETRVHVLTEARAGYLVAYWIGWLQWTEIVHIAEHLDSCIVHCVDAEAAELVARRLIGA